MSILNFLNRLDGLKKGLAYTLSVFASLFFSAGIGYAQETTVSGTVSDENGEPLIGASVFVEGNTSVGTVTDLDGKYTLAVPADAISLVFSYIGMSDLKETINGRTVINAVLKTEYSVLEATVVTAMGISKAEKSLSYNVQEMELENITPTGSFVNALNGKVAGVVINTSSSGIGGGSRVVMRGTKSISNNNNALYVIDGIPMPNLSGEQPEGVYAGAGQTGDGLSAINPDDIASISVLSGPSAAALYGSAAANGVVIITTKKGSKDSFSLNYSNTTEFSRAYIMPSFQNTYGATEAGSYQSWGAETSRRFNPREFFNTGSNINNSVAVSMGSKRNQTYLSVATTNASNIIPNSGYNRYNFTFRNTTSFLNDKMTLDVSASYVIQNNKNMIASGEYFNPLPALYLFPRGEDFDNVRMYQIWDESRNLYDQNWTYGSGDMSFQNPYWIMHKMINQSKKHRYMLSASLKYDITKWLNIVGRVKVDNSNIDTTNKRYAGTNTNFAGEKGLYNIVKRNDMQIYADAIANVDVYLARDWHLTANVGASIKDVQMDLLGWGGDLRQIPNFFSITNISTTSYREREDGSRVQSQSVFANDLRDGRVP